LSKLKRNGAPGADDIPPSFLKELGPNAISELLAIFNLCFLSADIPQQWRHAIIIPLLKAGKPASEVDSYRPISLTSCVVKLLERLISNRLYNMAENRSWLINEQAGFRRGYCTEDQILKLVQQISDGFQKKLPERTVIALLDYSKAYDRTWRERLLQKLIELGVPTHLTRWIAAFLRTRTAEVMINGTLSKRVRMKQGLPQGSVLSPLLFVIFINDILKDLPDDVSASLFADDAAVYASDTNLITAQEKLQKGVTAIEKWSCANKLDLNVKKSCTYFFSTDTHEAKWRPSIELLGSQMSFGEGKKELCPKFLGIRLDRTLCFKDHVEEVCQRVIKRSRMLSCLASKSWGWKKKGLKRIYFSMIRSILDYAAAAWQPFLSPTQFEKLEVAQNRCLRLITAQYANTYVEILRLEAGIPSYRTHSDRLTAIAYEKGKRLPAEHPRRQAVDGPEEPVAHRSAVRSSFRKHAEELINPLSISGLPREPVMLPFPETWDEPEPERNWTIHTNETIKHDIPAIGRLVDSLLADVNIYTDGSCKDGTRDGGAAAVVTFGTFDDPQRLEVVKAKGDTHTSSYNEETRALNLGIDWLCDAPLVEHCAFLTDSLSLLQAIDNEHPETAVIRSRLQSACNRVDLLYVPGHKDIPGNEMADTFAKEAARDDGPPANQALSLRTAKAIIRREIVDPPTTHRLASQFYAEVSQERDHAELKSRKDAGLLAQLRAGHQQSLGYYQHFVGAAESDVCERCTTGETDDTAHWLLSCPSTSAARQRIFGTDRISMMELGLAPAKIVELARCTLSL
jgi:ribonuclease HI